MQRHADRVDGFHQRIVGRLLDLWFGEPIINNVERGPYVEAMVESALQGRDPDWHLTEPWAGWDIQHEQSGVRIQVKQSAMLQRWKSESPSPQFKIPPSSSYWDHNTRCDVPTPLQRQGDVYVFAWHPEKNTDVADHRLPEQWRFYVVAERQLPQDPLTDSISLGPLRNLTSPCNYDVLADTTIEVVSRLRSLKANTAKTG